MILVASNLADREDLPRGYVVYREQELKELFGEGKPPLSPGHFKLVHGAKRLGGAKVIGQEEDTRRLPTGAPLVIWKGTVDEYRSLFVLREAELIVAKAQLTDDEYIDLRIKDKILDLEKKIADLRKWLAEALEKTNEQ